MKLRTAAAVASLTVLGGCGWILPRQAEGENSPLMWIQSTLVPAGPHADKIATLSWIMFAAGTLILLLVVAFTALAIFGGRYRHWMANRTFVMGFGIIFPVAVLTALLVYGLSASRTLGARTPPALRVEVIGERWWWRVHYMTDKGEISVVSANEIRVPTGATVEFILKTLDVIHSFWVPNLAGKLDMIPGRTNSTQFAVDKPGVYRGQCAEYCGAQHALMAFYLVAMSPNDFKQWYEREAGDAAEPQTAFRSRGRELFISFGCGACHEIRGTSAAGKIGPDLTHMGGRLSIAAGTYPTSAGTLADWISSSQHLKPKNLMPSFSNLTGEELRAIAEYLESLK